MRKFIKKSWFICLIALLNLSCVFAQTFTTNYVDDYTNSKNGTTSKAYTFSIDGVSQNALGTNNSSTDMTWAQWLNINADGFNDDGYYVVTTNGGSVSTTEAFTIKYNLNYEGASSTINDDFAYTGENVVLPSISREGFFFNGWWTASDGGNKVGNSGENYKVNSSLTLYAHWSATLNLNEVSDLTLFYNDITDEDNTRYKHFTHYVNSVEENINLVKEGSGQYEFKLNSNTIIEKLTNDGITVKYGTNPGYYEETVTVVDTLSKKELQATLKIYVKYLMTGGYADNGEGDLIDGNTTVAFPDTTYAGTKISIDGTVVQVKMNDGTYKTLKNGNDYVLVADTMVVEDDGSVSYKIDAGEYKVLLYGGNERVYVTSRETSTNPALTYKLTVKKANTSELIEFDYQKEWTYTGKEIKPTVYKMSSEKKKIETESGTYETRIEINENQILEQFDIEYSNNINPTKEALITLTPKADSNFEGDSVKLYFTIDAPEMIINVINGQGVYNGQEQTGGATVEVSGAEVGTTTISYSTDKETWVDTIPGFIDVGTHAVYYKVENEYYDIKEGEVTIMIAKDENELDLLNIKGSNGVYPYSFEFNYELKYPTDVVVSENTSKAVVEITPNEDKSGGTIKVTPVSSDNNYAATISFLAKATDNVNSASAQLTFSVSLGEIKLTAYDREYTYDGNPHEVDYTVTYPEDTKTAFKYFDGTKTVTTTTKPSFTNAGSYTAYFTASKDGFADKTGQVSVTIKPKSIASATVEITKEDGEFIYYDGSKKTPPVTVTLDGKTLKENADYALIYTNNIDVGTATIIITGINNYTDSLNKSFIISNKNDTAVKLTWKERVDGVLTTKEAAYDKEKTWTVDGNATEELIINTTYTGNSQNANMEFAITPENGQIYYSVGSKATTDSSQEIPTFVMAGDYRIYFLITWHGYKDVEGSFILRVNKLSLSIPSVKNENVCLKIDDEENALSTTPKWSNYNPLYMSMGGDTSALEIKVDAYITSFDLVDKVNTQWSDGTVSTKNVYWYVNTKCNRTEEIIYELNALYGQYKEIMLENKVNDDGTTTYENEKTAFTREGYVQAGWVENRDDHSVKYDIAASVMNLKETEGDVKDLYALWERAIYTIDIDYDGGKLPSITTTTTEGKTTTSILTNPSVVAYDTYFTLTEPVKAGYTFVGWEIWNMDETEHYIGTVITTDTTYETIENVFKNLTSVANSTVYFKAKWEANKIWTKNYTWEVNSSVSDTIIEKAFNEATNGSGNYTYKITSVTPNASSCNFVVTNNSLNYGYSSCPNKGTLQGFSIDEDKNLTVPSYLKVGTYVVAIKVNDEFTKKETTFYIDIVVKNPEITITETNGNSNKYEYEPSSTVKQWVDSSYNTDGKQKKYSLITECAQD